MYSPNVSIFNIFLESESANPLLECAHAQDYEQLESILDERTRAGYAKGGKTTPKIVFRKGSQGKLHPALREAHARAH